MKKLFLAMIITSAFSVITFAQSTPKFDLTKDGVAPVVLNFDAGLSAIQIYNKVKTWNPALIKYPQASIRADKENTMLKFGGHIDQAWKIRDNNFDHWYTLEYTLVVDIKDGKCRVTFETPEVKYKVWYNANGTTVPRFKDSEASFEASINKMLTSLYGYIKGAPKKTEDSW